MKITIFKRPGRLVAGCCLLMLASGAFADVTDSFTATYKINYGFISLGTMAFQLQPAAQPGCYVYTGQGHPNAIVAMLVGNLSDKSRFCVTDNSSIQPEFYRHHEKGSPKHSYSLLYNWADKTVRYQNRAGHIRVMNLPPEALDPLSLQIAVRMWLADSTKPESLPDRTFTLIDANKVKKYTLTIKPGGTINVPAGRYDTLVVSRADSGKGKTIRFWMAAYADWLPVKVEREHSGRVLTMTLTQVDREKKSTPATTDQ